MQSFSFLMGVLGTVALHATWILTIIGLLYAAIIRLSPQSAQWRYRVGITGLIAMTATIPFSILLSISFQSSPLMQHMTGAEATAEFGFHAESLRPTSEFNDPDFGQTALVKKAIIQQQGLASSSIISEAGERQAPDVSFVNRLGNYFPIISLVVSVCYLTGFLIMASRLIGNLIGCQGLVRASQLIRTGEIYDQLPDLCRRCGIDGLPSIAISTEVLTPVVVGIVRPCILLPSALISGLTPKQIEVILLHELMHIRRLDQWVLLWQAALETLLFYHPTVWVINRQLNESREHCCDDQVVQLGIQPIDYVRALFEVAENTILSTNRGVSKGRWQTDWQSLASQMTGRNTPSSAN